MASENNRAHHPEFSSSAADSELSSFQSKDSQSAPIKTLKALFQKADYIGSRRYNRLTSEDWENYESFDIWRYVNGDYGCGTTKESQQWAYENSDPCCPICERRFADCGGRTIDHKLPRAQYPWLAMEFRNFWVICKDCNDEKGEKHWYEYELYMLIHHPNRMDTVRSARPLQLLKSLKVKRS